MSEDTKSSYARRTGQRKILIVANPDDIDSSDDDHIPPSHQSQGSYTSLSYHPLPTPSSSRPQKPSHAPYPLTTDLHYPSNSKPPLSSPSSSGSARIDSTPPPTTPGQTAPPVDISGGPYGKHKPVVVQPPVERSDYSQPSHRPPSKFMPRLPWSHRRGSSNRPLEPESLHSPSPSCPSPTSSLSMQIDNVLLVVTSDCHTYKAVDISSARSVAYVRERMFTELCISDEEQSGPLCIYRTEIGKYAIGEALTDDQLFKLIREEGDAGGNLKFFICVSGAQVHEHHQPSLPTSPIRSIPPPPVLPVYGPLRPRPRRQSKSRCESVSSEDPTPDAGYEPSVSDDVDFSDNRSTMRPPPHSILAAQQNQPNSPRVARAEDRNPPSPVSAKPFPSATERTRDHEIKPSSLVQSNIAQSPPDSRTDSYLNLPKKHIRKTSDAADREKALLDSEYAIERADYERNHKEKTGLSRFNKMRIHRGEETVSRKPREETWVVVPHDNDSPAEGSKGSPSRPNPKKTRTRDEGRRGGQQVPLSYLPFPWYGNRGDKGDSKSQNNSSPWPTLPGKTLKGAMSVESLRGISFRHPKALQPGPSLRPSASRPQLNQGGMSSTYLSGSNSSTTISNDSGSRYLRPLPNPTIDTANSSSSPNVIRPNPQSPPANNAATLLSPQDPYQRPHSASPSQSRSPYARNQENLIPDRDKESTRLGHSFQPSQTSINSGSRPGTSPPNDDLVGLENRLTLRDIMGSRTSHTHSEGPRTPPPRSPNNSRPSTSTSTSSFSYEPSTMVPSRSISGEGTMGSDSTLRPEDKDRILDFIGSGDKTLDPKAWSSTKRRSSTSPTAEPTISTYEHSRSASHDGTATIGTFSEYGTAGLWSTPMKELLSQELQTPTTHPRPPLTVDTNSGTAMPRVTQADPAKFPLPPTYAVPRQRPRTPRDHKRRTFEDYTWAPRPPAEDVYNRLEEFFPGHDLDRPVIEASSGGTSPTAVEHPSIAAPAFDRDKVLVKGKKSIRIVAEEHKKRIDRTSRAESSYSNINRKRSTKLWDSRLVEVTTSQSKTNLSRALPDSPSGGPKPIFKWVRGELIGKGTYGRVYLALNATTGEMIAVKQVEIPTTASDRNDTRQASLVQALKMESETLKDLDHPNIVQYLGFEETPNFLSIFLEYVPGGSIGSCLQKHGKFDEEVTKSFTSQILSGLEYLHSKNILHRDLKADNILVETSGICKISDFGISKRTDDINGGAHTAMQGTIFWMAPEVINTPKGKGYNSKIDIWSVGCVVLEMWAGKRPWNEEEAVAVMLKLFNTKQPPPVPDDVILTSLAKDFKDRCFAVDPKDRPSAAELRCHPYLELAEGWTFSDFK